MQGGEEMKSDPIRYIICDLCGKDNRMKSKYDYGWYFGNPKGWVTIDASKWFKEEERDFCPACMKTMKEIRK